MLLTSFLRFIAEWMARRVHGDKLVYFKWSIHWLIAVNTGVNTDQQVYTQL